MKSKSLIYSVSFLLIVSLLVAVYGLYQKNSQESTQIISLPPELVTTETIEDSSLEEYFNNLPSEAVGDGEDSSYYRNTDPFRNKCLQEGGSYGIVCYY